MAVRRYGEDVFIAHTLGFPLVSAADATHELALAKLKRSLVHVLEHLHPRMLYELPEPLEVVWSRVTLAVQDEGGEATAYDGYEAAAGEDVPADGPDALEEASAVEEAYAGPLVAVDIVGRRFAGGLMHLQAPLYHLDTWMLEEQGGEGDWAGEGMMFLLEQLKASRGSGVGRRAVPDAFEVTALEVEVEAMDLATVEEESRWRDYFDAEDLTQVGAASVATPTLEDVAQMWAGESGKGTEGEKAAVGHRFGPVFCREEPLGELVRHVEGKIPAAVVLVGPARVGKTALVKAYARRLLEEGAKKTLWFADSPRLCATDPMSPGWQLQCREIVRELELSGDVLYMGRLVEALDAGKYLGSDYNLAQFLKPHLADQRIRVVAEATVEEWAQIERRDVGFARAFTVMRLVDPEPEVGLEIVRRESERRAALEGVKIGAGAIERAWSLQRRFATEGSPVGRTIDFVARTLTRVVQDLGTEITLTQMVESFCEETGMPPVLLLDDRTLDLEAVRAQLSKRVIGQPEAVARVADVVGVTKAGLAAEDRPLGSFLFVGSTGVGKTELAKALAEFLFGSESRLVRLDMSEYASADGYQRLIGQVAGEEGDLTGPVRRQPFSVVLLDEIEKAHASVFDLLLQVLGEARLTDAAGRTTRFQNTILILTSNLGVESLRPAMGFAEGGKADAGYASHFRREAERFFRAEFLGRIDQFIAFAPLDAETVTAIAARELAGLRQRDGLMSRDMELEFAPEVAGWLAQRGWDVRYGARPIKRAVEREIVWPLAAKLAEFSQMMAAKKMAAGGDEKRAGMWGGLIRVRVGEPVAAGEEPKLVWEVSERSQDGESGQRSLLLEQLEEVSELRRRLRHCLYADVFTVLEWKIDQYDAASQSEHFWKSPDASKIAQEAELARKVVAPIMRIDEELTAFEDFATEAYHSHEFDIVGDLQQRISELQARLDDAFLDVMRTAYQEPDSVVLFMASRNAQDPWRALLVDWYGKLCAKRGWKTKLWRSRTGHELARLEERTGTWRDGWVATKDARGQALALEIVGKGARPLLQGEDGLHRILSPEGSQSVDVVVYREGEGPGGDGVMGEARASASVVRSWNLRTREVTMEVPGVGAVSEAFEAQDPWAAVWPWMEEVAWRLVDVEAGGDEVEWF